MTKTSHSLRLASGTRIKSNNPNVFFIRKHQNFVNARASVRIKIELGHTSRCVELCIQESFGFLESFVLSLIQQQQQQHLKSSPFEVMAKRCNRIDSFMWHSHYPATNCSGYFFHFISINGSSKLDFVWAVEAGPPTLWKRNFSYLMEIH